MKSVKRKTYKALKITVEKIIVFYTFKKIVFKVCSLDSIQPNS